MSFQMKSTISAWLILLIGTGLTWAQLKNESTTTSKPTATELKLVGDWQGRLLGQLEMIFHLSAPAKEAQPWSGTFDVPMQNAMGLDLGNIVIRENAIQFDLKGVPGNANFEGKLAADGLTIEGRFRQGIVNQPMTLKKKVAEPSSFDPKAIDELANRLLAEWKAPGLALAIVKDGKVVHAAGYGFKNVEKKEPMTADTLLAIGSCTKAFTTTLLAGLVDEGKLDWDRPVQEYWPEFRMNVSQTTDLITLRDMVTHRTGLPRHDLIWFAGELPRAEILKRIEHLPVAAPIRQKWIYNNLMFVTASAAAERATGKTWEELMRQRILEPLEMKRTTLHINEMQKDANYATGYHAEGVAKEGFAVKPYREIAGMAPAGSINSSVIEMTKWMSFQLGTLKPAEKSPLPGRKTVEMLHQPQMIVGGGNGTKEVHSMGYAMGWGVESYRGHRHVEHGGAIDGFVAQVELFPDDNFGIVALVNQSGSGLPGVICPMIADRLLKMEPIDWSRQALEKVAAARAIKNQAGVKSKQTRVAGTRPSHELKAFSGTFANPGYGRIAFEIKENEMKVRYGITEFALEHWHYDQFVAKSVKPEDDAFENRRFIFQTDATGEIASVLIDLEPMTPPILFQRAADARLSDEKFLNQLAGEYELATQVITIIKQGNQLSASLPGQPVYRLVSGKGLRFQFDGLPGFHLVFEQNEKGEISGLTVEQPDGNYAGKRKK